MQSCDEFLPLQPSWSAEWHRTPLSLQKARHSRLQDTCLSQPPLPVRFWEEGWENWEEANSLPHTEQELKTVLWDSDWTDDGLENRARVPVPPCPSARLQQSRGPEAVAQVQCENSWKGVEGAGVKDPPAEQGGCCPGRSPLAIHKQYPAHPCDCSVAHDAETHKLHGSGGGHSSTSWHCSPSPPGDQAQAASGRERADP